MELIFIISTMMDRKHSYLRAGILPQASFRLNIVEGESHTPVVGPLLL
jgi:hypothetical protein